MFFFYVKVFTVININNINTIIVFVKHCFSDPKPFEGQCIYLCFS